MELGMRGQNSKGHRFLLTDLTCQAQETPRLREICLSANHRVGVEVAVLTGRYDMMMFFLPFSMSVCSLSPHALSIYCVFTRTKTRCFQRLFE